jgi:DNA-binding NarL/FixJ family response regulator
MSPSLNPPQPPDPSSPTGRQRQEATSKPLAAPLGRVGVAIVDDDENVHVLVRDILDRAQEFSWVGSYSSGEAALAGIPQSGAHIVLMDIKMPGMSGIECARRLKALHPHLVIVMITGLDDPRTINLAQESGADRFLPKPFTASHVLATLLYCIPKPGGQNAQLRNLRGGSLTPREDELMRYVAEGLLNKEIAERMGVSIYVIHKLQSSAFKKLGARNRTEAIRNWRQ